jgi:hypothetical protein
MTLTTSVVQVRKTLPPTFVGQSNWTALHHIVAERTDTRRSVFQRTRVCVCVNLARERYRAVSLGDIRCLLLHTREAHDQMSEASALVEQRLDAIYGLLQQHTQLLQQLCAQQHTRQSSTDEGMPRHTEHERAGEQERSPRWPCVGVVELAGCSCVWFRLTVIALARPSLAVDSPSCGALCALSVGGLLPPQRIAERSAS